MANGEWYWCLDHNAAEPAYHACSADNRMGPYPTKEAAVHWKDKVEARNKAWDDADKEWTGDDDGA